MVDEFIQHHGRQANLLSCGLCGMREYEKTTQGEYKQVEINNLPDCVKLSEEQTSDFNKAKAEPPVPVYSDSSHNVKHVHLWKAKSVYEHREENGDITCYHLHPELVETDDGIAKTCVCPACYKSVFENGQPAKFSIARGVDFGSYFRLGLTPPNITERIILAKVRNYQTRVKLQSSTLHSDSSNRNESFDRARLRGHVILFPHDAPTVAKNILCDLKDIPDLIRLFCIGSEGKTDNMMNRMYQTSAIAGRGYVIHQWLTVLGKINILYNHGISDVPDITQLERYVSQVNQTVREQACQVNDADKVMFERTIGSDTAQARLSNSHQHEERNNSEHGEQGDVSFQYSMVSSRDRYEKEQTASLVKNMSRRLEQPTTAYASNHDMEASQADDDSGNSDDDMEAGKTNQASDSCNEETHDPAVTINNSHHIEADTGSASEDDDGYNATQREAMPVSEFDENDFAICGSFPDIFLFGNAYNCKAGHSDDMTKHLLMQYMSIPASSRELVFLLFDQQQRHAAVLGMWTQLKGKTNKAVFDKLVKVIKTSHFQDLLSKARQNPRSSSANKLMRLVLPVVNVGSSKVPYSGLERNSAVTKNLAMTRHYGPISTFLTNAPTDSKDPSTFRLTFCKVNNQDFPAKVDESFFTVRKKDSEFVTEGNVKIPCGYKQRLQAVIDNPVASAKEYTRLIDNILEILLGFESGMSRKTKWYKKRKKGLFGRNLAYYGVHEMQA